MRTIQNAFWNSAEVKTSQVHEEQSSQKQVWESLQAALRELGVSAERFACNAE